MQRREEEEDQPASNNEAGNIDPVRGYAIVDGIRIGVEVGALGFGTTRTLSQEASLLTAITAEGVCSALSLLIAAHEFWKVLAELCCRRDGRTVASTSHSPIEYSLYLSFRLLLVATSMVGVSLIGLDLAAQTTTNRTTIGLALITFSNFATRAISGSKHKATNAVLLSPEEEMERGLRRRERRARTRGFFSAVPNSQLVVAEQDAIELPLRQNPAFQSQGQVSQAPVRQDQISPHDVPLVSGEDQPPRESGLMQGRSPQHAAAPPASAVTGQHHGAKKIAKKRPKNLAGFAPVPAKTQVETVEPTANTNSPGLGK